MATPIIQSTGSSSGAGTAGQGRNDLQIGETVTLSDTEAANSGASYVWSFEDIPIGSSTVLNNPTTATPDFSPDVTGSYRVNCEVNGTDTSVEVLAVPLTNTGARIPSFEEEVEYDEAGNVKGWHPAMTDFMRQVDGSLGGGGSDERVKVTANDTTPDYLLAKLAAGAAISIVETNDSGDEDATVAVSNLTDSEVAAANVDGVAGTASLRTLGTGAQQATAGNDSRLSDARTPLTHAASHEDGGGDEISVAALSGVLADYQKADVIQTDTGPTDLAVGGIADGEFLQRSGATIIGGTPAGGGGGSTVAARGDYLAVELGTGMTAALSLPQRVLYDTANSQRGDLVLDVTTNVGRISGLKAGRTYYLEAQVRGQGSGGFWQYGWHDVTADSAVGESSFVAATDSGSTSSSNPMAHHIMTPSEDTEVEVRITSVDDVNDDIVTLTSARIIEIGAVQADVIGGLEYLDTIEVASDQTTVTFGAGGDGLLGTALDGEVDGEYEMSYFFPDPGATIELSLRPNGISANQEGARVFGGTALSDSVFALLPLGSPVAGFQSSGLARLSAKTGQWRFFQNQQSLYTAGTTGRYAVLATGRWEDTTTAITSLDIHSDTASGIKAGARFVLWRRTTNNLRTDSVSTYERNVEATVAQGTNGEVEYTTGHATRQGSAIGLSVSLNDTVTAGSITVNLKVAGSTVLTTILDTTNTVFHRTLEDVGVHGIAPGNEIVVGIATSSLTTTGGGTPGITVNAQLTIDGLAKALTNVVGETVLDAASDTISVAGLDGDAHGEYEVSFHLLIADGGTHNIDIEPNGPSPSSVFGRYFTNFASPTAFTSWRIVNGLSTFTSREMVGTSRLSAARTQGGESVQRVFSTELQVTLNTTPYGSTFNSIGYWGDATDNLTQLDIKDSVASGFLAGSRMTVRRV